VTALLARAVREPAVTVVVAHAGAGKTTAVRQLAAAHDGPVRVVACATALDDAAAISRALAADDGGLVGGVLGIGHAEPDRLATALVADLAAGGTSDHPLLTFRTHLWSRIHHRLNRHDDLSARDDTP
jgi:hypothetical protein